MNSWHGVYRSLARKQALFLLRLTSRLGCGRIFDDSNWSSRICAISLTPRVPSKMLEIRTVEELTYCLTGPM